MRVLVLSPYPAVRVLKTLTDAGDTFHKSTDADPRDYDFTVSYGHRKIIAPEVVEACRGRIINLHISLLPWNRGADPIFWAAFDHTPMGITIHQIDEGIDTGPVLAQMPLGVRDTMRLDKVWERHHHTIMDWFDNWWRQIRAGKLDAEQQADGGSYHRTADKKHFFDQLSAGWQSTIGEVREMGAAHYASVAYIDKVDAEISPSEKGINDV